MKNAVLLLSVMALALSACGESTTAKRIKNPGAPKPDGAMNSGDVVARLSELNGQQVSIANCVLATNVDDQGKATCTLADDSGQNVSDANGLPIRMLFSVADLDPVSKAYLENGCPENLCNSHLSGTMTVLPGTNAVEVTQVRIGRNEGRLDARP